MKRLSYLFMVATLLIGLLPMTTAAQPSVQPTPIPAEEREPAGGIDSMSGSNVTFDPSAGGNACFTPGQTQTFCFRAESFNVDGDSLYGVWLKFPTDWFIHNVTVQGTPVCDSGWPWDPFDWWFEHSPNEVEIAQGVYTLAGDHCVATYCVEVESGTGTPHALESWYYHGSNLGAAPHHPCSSDQYTPSSQSGHPCDEWVNPQASIPPCAGVPDIAVTPTSLAAEQCPDTQTNQTLAICNNGTGDLIWGIGESAGLLGGGGSPAIAPGGIGQNPLPGGGQRVELSAAPAGDAVPAVDWDTDAAVSLVLDDGSLESTTGLGNGMLEFLWLNRFTPDPAVYPFSLDQVAVYFANWGNVQVGDDIEIVLYENTSGNIDPAVGSTYRASMAGTIQALNAWNVYTLPEPVAFAGPGDVLVGVIALEKPGAGYVPASLDETAPKHRSWTGLWSYSPPPSPPTLPPNGQWDTIDDLGLFGNWMLRASGQTLDAVPWLGKSPESGTVSPGECADVTVTFDSTEMTPGAYASELGVYSNDYDTPVVAVPVDLTVSDCPRISLTPPSQQGSTTCVEAQATYLFDLLNASGVDSFFDITVGAAWTTTCPAQVYAADHETVSFECTVGVPIGGDTDTAIITASGQGFTDSATATTVVDRTGQWVTQPPSPLETQGGAVISWAGKLYLVGGSGAGGAVQIWDGASWTVGAANGTDAYEYDACLGLDAGGNPVIDLLGNPSYHTSIWRYDINGNSWANLPMPAGYPEFGLDYPEIVSMLQHTGENVCYISGGSAAASGNPAALYAYDPAAGSATNLGTFTYHPFDLIEHFAWWVPWVEGGAICIAGGRDRWDAVSAYTDSQCYVLSTGVLNAPNADLGPLPESRKEGGDAWREHEGAYQIWGFHGHGADMQVLQASFYAAPGQGFAYGPQPVNEFLAVEGDNYNGSIWAGNGSTAGYWASTLQESLDDCPTSCVPPSDADFAWSPPGPFIGDVVTFTAATPGGTGPHSYDWTFGDGSSAAGKTVGHAYAAPGDYLVTLTVTNDCGTAQAQHMLTVTGYPDLVLTPPSLEATLPTGSLSQQTLSVCNLGAEPLTWALTEAEGTKALAPALSQGERGTKALTPALSQGEIGPLSLPLSEKLPPAPGQPSQPAHPDAVLWEQAPDYSYQLYSDLWVTPGFALWTADDFENADPWQIDTIHLSGGMAAGSLGNAAALHWCLYPDAGGAPAGHPFVGGEAWCWSTVPADPAVTLGGGAFGGDVTLDVVAGQGSPLNLPAGHWWLLFYPEFPAYPDDVWVVLLTGAAVNLADAHFVDPLDMLGYGLTSWTALSEIGAGHLDMAFRLEGVVQAYDIPWLSEDPTSGTVLPGECGNVTATFNSTGLDVGTYAGSLEVWSNDPDTPQATVPVNLTVEPPGAKITVTPDSLGSEQCPGTQTTQALTICSVGTEDLVWALSEYWDLPWLSEDPTGGTLIPGACQDVTVTFDSTGLGPGGNGGTLQVDSNDADQPQVYVSANMTVDDPAHGADFWWDPSPGMAGETVHFYGGAQGTEPIDYAWDFGDGTSGTGTTAEHAYAERGTYHVVLTAANVCATAAAEYDVEVLAWPQIGVTPASIEEGLCPDGQASREVTVCNSGDLPLQWSLFETPQIKGPAKQTLPDDVTSTEPPAGYVPAQAKPTNVTGGTVAMLKNVNAWDSTSAEDILTANGIPYEVHGSAEFATLDFGRFGMVWFDCDQDWVFYEDYDTYAPKFEQYVLHGGFLVFCAAPGWNGGDLYTPLPGGMTTTFQTEYYNIVEDPAHPTMAGVPSPFWGSAASNVSFTDLPVGARVIAHGQNSGEPTTVEYGLGTGWMIAVAQPLQITYDWGWDGAPILPNALLWAYASSGAGGADIPWLSEDPTSGIVPPGECQEMTVTFDSTGLAPNEYAGSLDIASNDPAAPDIMVPVILTVLDPVHDADFSWDPSSPDAGQDITFTAAAQGSGPLDYAWDLGDGGTAGGAVATHAYAAAGTYVVTLTVSNGCGQQVITHEVVVLPPPCDPVHDADFSWAPASPYAGQRVTFTGTAQGDGPIWYTWGFDPGVKTLPEANPVTYRFMTPGDYVVSMSAWNACGGQFVQHTVTVAPAPLQMHISWIRMSYVDRGLGRYAVLGRVRIVDAARAAVPSAAVQAEWTAPDGTTTAQQQLTNVTGVASFKVPTALTGTWQLCVTDAVLAGWVYDPAANLETCDTITIP